MARISQSRNLKGFGWLTKKRVTYRRDVGAERRELKRHAIEERKERILLKKLEAEERAADAKIAAATRKIEAAGKKTDQGVMSDARFEAMKARMESEIAKQEEYKAAARTRAGNPGCASTRKSQVSDRAKRYRANQPGCKPRGVKKCKLCGAKSDLMVDHVDGFEENNRRGNLRWLCRSCNTLLGAEMARTGEGRRTVQYNPGGAKTLWEYTQAVLQHTRKAHDAAGKIIHETPKWKRREFAGQIWDARHGRGTASPGSASAGHDEPDWVTNPRTNWGYGVYAQDTRSAFQSSDQVAFFLRASEAKQFANEHNEALKAAGEWYSQAKPHYHVRKALRAGNPAASPEQYRMAQAVLSGTARQARMSPEAAREIVDRTPARLRSEYSRRNPALEFSTEYHLGYNLGQADRQSASLRKTLDELHATFAANFPPESLASWESFETAYAAGYSGQMGAAAPNPKHERPFQYKGVTITPVPPTFTRYDVALPTGTIRLSSIQDAKDWITRQTPNPEAWTTIYKTRAAAQSAWYDSAPGRNDHATFKKVRGGWVIKVASRWNPGSPKLRALLKRMTSDQQSELTRAIDRFYYAALDEGFKPGEAQSFAEKRAVPEAEKILKRNNPEPQGDGSEEYQQALRTAELFHGRPVKEQIEVEEKIRTHDWYVSIGPLIKLIIKPLTKKPKKRVPLPFHQSEAGQVQLFCSPDGLQFYLRGGDQELDLDAFGMGQGTKWFRDHMKIGEAVEITYRDRKKFHSFKLTDYFHKLGEETGDKPTFVYDSLSKKMGIIGGAYRIEMEDLVDGMSPGIVN